MKKASEITFFVVDDERIIAETLAAIIKIEGFSSSSFVNPWDALEAAGDEVPDWLISDVMMPQLSGIELAIRMQERCPRCRILLFSGAADTLDLLKEAREQGHSFQLLAKPVHPSVLLQQIRARNVCLP
ncbi:response regulator [Granulicella arctica]|uniref:response regulator n=1 Tax=Granulicella arctica TaxID=940613 RepID=UPI0021E0A517|nr:response regulator [Granulicella arctica]